MNGLNPYRPRLRICCECGLPFRATTALEKTCPPETGRDCREQRRARVILSSTARVKRRDMKAQYMRKPLEANRHAN